MRWLGGPKFEQTLGDSEGQGSLACCSPWGLKESDMTEQLNYKAQDSERFDFQETLSLIIHAL